ncbi:MAG: Wzz/FepE/Etk N-terminal domain-containing protein [Pyrinomonadaceae bacterium]
MRKDSSGNFKAQGLSLRDAVVVLFRHRWLIVLTFLTTAAAAFVLAYVMPDQYESRMKILVRNMRSDVVVSPEQTDPSSNDNEISETQIVSEIELLKSRDLLEQVVKNTNLAQLETKNEPTAQNIEKAVYKLQYLRQKDI